MKCPPTDFWAKLSDDRTEWHTLLAHSADVAAMVESLLQRTILRKRLAALLGWADLLDVHVARLAALSAVHDAGKVNHNFQDQAFGPVKMPYGHVRPIVDVFCADDSHVERLLTPLGIEGMVDWFETGFTLNQYLLATWGHHGRPVKPASGFDPRLWVKNGSGRDPVAGLEAIGTRIRAWFPQAFEGKADPFPATTTLQHAYNGLLTLADWIGSTRRFFDYCQDLDDPMPRARHKAARAIESLFLDPSTARRGMGLHPVGFVGILDNPYPIQLACYELELHTNGSLTILESDTGSGKTEAAVARFVRLYQAGLVDGMYFAVPTRSAATQLHQRIQEIVRSVFPDSACPPVIQAVPGYVRVDDDEPTRLDGFDVLWEDEELQYRGWAAENAKRYLAGPIMVGTVDQVLLSTLQVKHAHMRAAALLRHFLVVDEVHASDVYMTDLMDAVLQHHLAAGGHALLMSATLGSSARLHLSTTGKKEKISLEEAERQDYPLLTHVDALRRNPRVLHAPSSGFQKTVHRRLLPVAGDPFAVAREALGRAKAGARVLVIRNLVADCIATQRALEEIAGERTDLLFGVGSISAPHHGRFAPYDRKQLDEFIERAFGKGSDRKGIVAVATQTVEQSLDICADVLITDLCPIDVLLQRIGRLHRHPRLHPAGFEEALCLVLTPAERDLTAFIERKSGKGSRGKHGLGTVYDDLRMIEAAWQVLEQDTGFPWRIPQDNRRLVERGTHPDRLRDIVQSGGENWEKHQQFVLGQIFADQSLSRLVKLERHKPFGDQSFAENLDQIKTRLGDDDVRVAFSPPVPGPFGNRVDVLTIPTYRVKGELPDDLTAENVEPFDRGFTFSFAGKQFQYSRMGLEFTG